MYVSVKLVRLIRGKLKIHILQNLTFVKYVDVSIGYGREKDASGVVKCGSLDLHIFLPVLKKSPWAFCPRRRRLDRKTTAHGFYWKSTKALVLSNLSDQGHLHRSFL